MKTHDVSPRTSGELSGRTPHRACGSRGARRAWRWSAHRRLDHPRRADRRLRLFGPSGPRNLLLVSLDTVRADRLGCYHYAAAQTPQIDALASVGPAIRAGDDRGAAHPARARVADDRDVSRLARRARQRRLLPWRRSAHARRDPAATRVFEPAASSARSCSIGAGGSRRASIATSTTSISTGSRTPRRWT